MGEFALRQTPVSVQDFAWLLRWGFCFLVRFLCRTCNRVDRDSRLKQTRKQTGARAQILWTSVVHLCSGAESPGSQASNAKRRHIASNRQTSQCTQQKNGEHCYRTLCPITQSKWFYALCWKFNGECVQGTCFVLCFVCVCTKHSASADTCCPELAALPFHESEVSRQKPNHKHQISKPASRQLVSSPFSTLLWQKRKKKKKTTHPLPQCGGAGTGPILHEPRQVHCNCTN